MTQLTFYPLGNADTTLIEFRDGRRMLVDYAARRTGIGVDRRCDLPALLEADLKRSGRSDYAAVAFTHLDDDHCQGAEEFFHLEFANKYQGGGRHKIGTMWVPAGAITEEGLGGSARIIRQEARHRLIAGKGIVVFSRPERLAEWLKTQGLTVKDRQGCIVDAGKPVQGFTLPTDGVEFFAHSPHAWRTDAGDLVDRNRDSLVFQVRFQEGGHDTEVLFSGDVTHEELSEIVSITRRHGNDDRLHWNVYHLPHHCSYTALSPTKGVNKTVPVLNVQWLCETQGERRGYIISPSDPIPLKGMLTDDSVQPPHRQAAAYYREDVLENARNLLVTMSEPVALNPQPIVIQITRDGAVKIPAGSGGSAAAAAVVAPRAG